MSGFLALDDERKNAEREQQVGRFVLHNIPVGIVFVNRRHEIIAANERAAEIFGYAVVGAFRLSRKLIEDLLPKKVRAQHVESFDAWFKNPREITLETRIAGAPFQALHANGEEFDVRVIVTPFDSDVCAGFCMDEKVGEIYAMATIIRPSLWELKRGAGPETA